MKNEEAADILLYNSTIQIKHITFNIALEIITNKPILNKQSLLNNDAIKQTPEKSTIASSTTELSAMFEKLHSKLHNDKLESKNNLASELKNNNLLMESKINAKIKQNNVNLIEAIVEMINTVGNNKIDPIKAKNHIKLKCNAFLDVNNEEQTFSSTNNNNNVNNNNRSEIEENDL